ncbi:MAG: hypothetical protein CM1200mP30_16760 [Pseudomonadota bacterium]|nr:MAG: hypothetical protein CM1200mP30_16760 [Pseudomonadota bacterium]
MTNLKKNNGIWFDKMELPELFRVAKSKESFKNSKNFRNYWRAIFDKAEGRGMEFAEADHISLEMMFDISIGE